MDQNPVVRPTYDFKSAKKQFSRIGLALVAFFAATYAAIFLIEFVLTCFPLPGYPRWLSVLISCVGMYGVGVPVFCLCLCGTKRAAPQKGKFSFGTIGILLLIAYAMSYVGSIVGILSTATLEALTGLSFTAGVGDLLMDLPWYVTLVYAVVVAPFFEEFVFRKMILDRTRAYGEKLAILFSAFMFAFFHTNLEQFFYAFLVGLVLAYLYLRTGKLTACWLLHGAYNFIGGFLPTLLSQRIDYDALTAEEQMQVIAENPVGYAMLMLYGFIIMAVLVAGSILLGIYKKRLHFEQAELTLPSDTEATTAFVNVGVILFIAVCVALAILSSILVQMA